MRERHRLLKRQLKRHFKDPDAISVDLQAFLESVNDAYWQADEDRLRLERSLELSSQELLQANSELQTLLQTVEQQVAERTRELTEANAELALALGELRTTQAQLIQTEKMSSLGQIVAGVAHEINNPVNFIYGNLVYVDRYTQCLIKLVQQYRQAYPNPPSNIAVELAESDLDFLIEDMPRLLKSMATGAERIQGMVMSLRNFSRMDESDFKRADLHEGLDSTLAVLCHRLNASSNCPPISLVKEYGQLPLIECYPSQLNQVFLHLLSNAIDAIEEARIRPLNATHRPHDCITLRTDCIDEQWVRISITDTGCGMSEQTQTQIFDPFFTTKPLGKGTGIGLSISYQIITTHSGFLTCCSKVGQGTEFMIELPIYQPAFKETYTSSVKGTSKSFPYCAIAPQPSP